MRGTDGIRGVDGMRRRMGYLMGDGWGDVLGRGRK